MRRVPSPNFGPRRGEAVPDLVVIHYTAMETAEAAIARLCAPEHEVSAHWVICPDGATVQLVDEEMRAWHAGAAAWGAVTDVNSHSIGIELANRGQEPFAAAQMRALEDLLEGIMARWAIRPERVIGHSDCAPGRKGDPGPRFDWRRLALQGLAVWPEATPQDGTAADFMHHMKIAGYTSDFDMEIMLRSLRLRFRPWAEGPLSPEDIGLARALAERFPVDPAPAGA